MEQPEELLLEVEMDEKEDPIEKKTFCCTLCSYSSDYRTNVKVHTTKVHKKKISSLECCDIRFSDRRALQKHLDEFHVHRYHCPLCNTGFYNATNLRRHEVICKMRTLKKETLQTDNLEDHQIKENEDLEPSSLPPKTKFNKPQKLSSLTLPLNAKLYKCTKCSFTTKYPHSFLRHMKLGHEVIFNCCGNRFTTKRGLREHQSVEHTKKFKCSICAQNFSSLLLLRSHQLTHSEHQNFKCNLCNYSSLWKSNLKKHVRVTHKDNFSPLSLTGQLDQDNHSLMCVELSDECDLPSEKEVDADTSSIRLLRTSRSQEAGKEVIKGEKTPVIKREQDNSKRKSRESNNGKENLDGGEMNASKNVLNLDFTRDLVDQQLKLRRKSITHEQINVKCSNRSPSLGERHSIDSAVSQNNSNSEMAEILSTSSDMSNLVLRLDSDEEALQSSSQTSLAMNKCETLQADFKGKKTKLLKKPTIYKCTSCPFKTKWRKSFKRHIKMHERQGIVCSPTNLSLNRASLKLSSSVKVNVGILTCSLCSYSTEWPGNLKMHTARIHGTNNFKCTFCPREFDSPYSLQHHQTVHSDSKWYKCSICEFTTSNRTYLTKHVRKHKLEEHHSLTSPLESDPENSVGQSVSQQQTALNRTAVSVPLKQTENEETNCDDGSISESDHLISSPQSIRFPPSATVRRSGRLATEKAPASMNDSNCQSLNNGSTLVINSIHDEARQIRAQIPLAMTVSSVLPLLQRLLEMSSSLTNLIHESMQVKACSQTIESFEYVWNTSKVAVVRWEDLKGLKNNDTSLNAVKYAYGTLPLFNNWEKSDHLEMLENAILLIFNTVKNSQLEPPNRSEFRLSETNLSSQRAANAKCRLSMPCLPSDQSRKGNVDSVAMGTTTKANVSAIEPSKENLVSLKEFCRLANISTWQNTKCRSRGGFKDDNGDFHTMYRVGIGKMLNLYCPLGVTHLKCCGKVFDLSELKDHVYENHEAGRPNRTEPSISPA